MDVEVEGKTEDDIAFKSLHTPPNVTKQLAIFTVIIYSLHFIWVHQYILLHVSKEKKKQKTKQKTNKKKEKNPPKQQ